MPLVFFCFCFCFFFFLFSVQQYRLPCVRGQPLSIWGPFGPLEFVQSAGCSFAIGCLRRTAAPKSNLAALRVVSRLDTCSPRISLARSHTLYTCVYVDMPCMCVCVLMAESIDIWCVFNKFRRAHPHGGWKASQQPFHTLTHPHTPTHTHARTYSCECTTKVRASCMRVSVSATAFECNANYWVPFVVAMSNESVRGADWVIG